MKLKTGDLVLVKNRGIIPWLIRWFTNSEYNHVAMIYEDDIVIESHLIERGVHFDDLLNESGQYDIYRYKYMTDAHRQEIKKLAFDYVDRRYDTSQIFGIFFSSFLPIPQGLFDSDDEVICSELFQEIYEKVGIYLSKKDLTPQGILDKSNDLFELIYEGVEKE